MEILLHRWALFSDVKKSSKDRSTAVQHKAAQLELLMLVSSKCETGAYQKLRIRVQSETSLTMRPRKSCMESDSLKREGYAVRCEGSTLLGLKRHKAMSKKASRNFTCLFKTRCFPFQYLSIWRACRVLTMSTGFTAVSWLISETEELLAQNVDLPTPPTKDPFPLKEIYTDSKCLESLLLDPSCPEVYIHLTT